MSEVYNDTEIVLFVSYNDTKLVHQFNGVNSICLECLVEICTLYNAPHPPWLAWHCSIIQPQSVHPRISV